MNIRAKLVSAMNTVENFPGQPQCLEACANTRPIMARWLLDSRGKNKAPRPLFLSITCHRTASTRKTMISTVLYLSFIPSRLIYIPAFTCVH